MTSNEQGADYTAYQHAILQSQVKTMQADMEARNIPATRKRGSLKTLPSAPATPPPTPRLAMEYKGFSPSSPGELAAYTETTPGQGSVPAADNHSSFRTMRFAITGVIVLVLLLVWFAQRRARCA